MSAPAPGPTPQSSFRSSLSGRFAPPTLADVRRKAHARLAERIDPARSRHKPLSILRVEAKRVLDQYFETECSALPRAERDKLAEDVIAEAHGIWPLEELIRDDGVSEILVLGPGQVIARKGDIWLPASVRFRDASQFRGVLTRLAEQGEALASPTSGGFDVRLPNGFRVLAIIPPEVMDQPPMALLVRAIAVPTPPTTTPTIPNPVVTSPSPSPSPSQSVNGPGSSVIPSHFRVPQPTPTTTPPPIGSSRVGPSDSGILSRTPAALGIAGSRSGSPSEVMQDPFMKIRQRVTERIISKLAIAGVYDLNMIPAPEMRRIVAAHVFELSEAERLGLDGTLIERLTLEILASMNR